jgi:hypothetical protein
MASEPLMTTPAAPAPPAPPAIPARPGSPLAPYDGPRWIPIALGAWLFLSAFLWPHSTGSAINSWIVGLLIVIAGLVALRMPWMRWVDTALAVWLFLSTLAIPDASRGTLWNNLIVAILVFLASLVPEGLSPMPRRPGRGARGAIR